MGSHDQLLPASTSALALALPDIMRSPGKKVKVKRCRRESEGGERERLRRLSGMETAAGCVLSERHPVAAGLFNTSVFVIIPHKQRGVGEVSEEIGQTMTNKENEGATPVSLQKPRHTYRELITQALMDRQFLNLGGIYKWICTNFPFFSASDDRWKNSIRHNLSLYPEFVKGVKTQENTGHLWHLDMVLIEKRRGRLQGVTKTMMEEDEGENEEEDERWARLSSSIGCPQTDLQRCALEILAGVKRPTTVETHPESSCGLQYHSTSLSSYCSYSSLLQDEEESWRNT